MPNVQLASASSSMTTDQAAKIVQNFCREIVRLFTVATDGAPAVKFATQIASCHRLAEQYPHEESRCRRLLVLEAFAIDYGQAALGGPLVQALAHLWEAARASLDAMGRSRCSVFARGIVEPYPHDEALAIYGSVFASAEWLLVNGAV